VFRTASLISSIVRAYNRNTTELEKYCETWTIATFQKLKLHIIRQYSRPWHEITAMAKKSRYTAKITVGLSRRSWIRDFLTALIMTLVLTFCCYLTSVFCVLHM